MERVWHFLCQRVSTSIVIASIAAVNASSALTLLDRFQEWHRVCKYATTTFSISDYLIQMNLVIKQSYHFC